MAEAKPIRLIAGLGNPGPEYERTRHNAGFWFVDELARKAGAAFRSEAKFHGEACRVRLGGRDVWLLKPSTYMNLSGQAVQAMASYYKIAPEEILVAHDEMDLPPGAMRLKLGGGNAGHNGLKDIAAKLGTPNFWRLRLGTGHPRTLGLAQQVFDFVLSAPSAEHEALIRKAIAAGLDEAEDFASGNLEAAQRRLGHFGTPPKPKKPRPRKGEHPELGATKPAEKAETAETGSELGASSASSSSGAAA